MADRGAVLFEDGIVVFLLVELEAEVAEILRDSGASFGATFADGAGEDEGVGAVKVGGHLADVSLDAVVEDLKGQRGAFVTFGGLGDDIPHIVGDVREAVEAAFFIEVDK